MQQGQVQNHSVNSKYLTRKRGQSQTISKFGSSSEQRAKTEK